MDLFFSIGIILVAAIFIAHMFKSRQLSRQNAEVHLMNLQRLSGSHIVSPEHYVFLKKFFEDELRRYEAQKSLTEYKDYSQIIASRPVTREEPSRSSN
ncbi:MAG: hypothetical protein D6677_03700 [Calditrichaeota bacterium]|nr:MAG: hypothetical protein D6677_03700 [Calditrichota bacterium]